MPLGSPHLLALGLALSLVACTRQKSPAAVLDASHPNGTEVNVGATPTNSTNVPAPKSETSSKDPMTRAYGAYLRGDIETAKEIFEKLGHDPGNSTPRLARGLTADPTWTDHFLIAKAKTGLLSIDRSSMKAVAWRYFEERVHSFEGLTSQDSAVVTIEHAGPTRLVDLLVLDARTLKTRFQLKLGPIRPWNMVLASPDGRFIAYLDPEGELRLMDAASYAPVSKFRSSVPRASDMRLEFSPDSTKLMVGADRAPGSRTYSFHKIALLSIPDGATLFERDPPIKDQRERPWAFSGDSRWLALAGGLAPEFQLIDTATGRVSAHTKKCVRGSLVSFHVDGTLTAADDPPGDCAFEVPSLKPTRYGDSPTLPGRGFGRKLPADVAERVKEHFCADSEDAIFPREILACY